MIIVCDLSYQDGEAIVHMKQNAIIPTEHQCSHNVTEILLTLLTLMAFSLSRRDRSCPPSPLLPV